jgi:acyl-CoA thioester hydrolase
LTLHTTVIRRTPVRIEHEYRLVRGTEVLAEGSSTLACVDKSASLQAMPEWLLDAKVK